MSTFENFMDRAWSLALSRLNPSSVDLQHGLELHRALPVCDNYAFLPKVFTSRLTERMNGLQDRGVGVIEWRQKSWAHRVTACLDDAGGASEFFAALDRADVCGLVQNVSDVGENLEFALMNIASHQRVCQVMKERVFQATNADDFIQARENGQTGVMFSLTGLPLSGSMADPDALLDWAEVWYNMGVRFMHMGYNRRNLVADGCTEARDGGLSDFGRDLVRRLNEVGITVDVPHSSPLTTEDVVAYTSKPVIATHIGCQAIFDHPRCKSDREIKQIAGTGGLVGIYALPSLLGPDADINLMLKHVRHAVDLVGADHVAIGTDISYIADWPSEIRPYPTKQNISDRIGGRNSEHTRHRSCDHLGGTLSWTNWPLFTTGLVQMGLSDGDIEKILGGNLRRVLRANRPVHELEALSVLREPRRSLEIRPEIQSAAMKPEIPVVPVQLNGKPVAANGVGH